MNKLVVVAVVVAMMLGFTLYAEAGTKGSIGDLLRSRQGTARPAISNPKKAGVLAIGDKLVATPKDGKVPKGKAFLRLGGKPASGKLQKIGKPASGKPSTMGSLLNGK